MPWSAWNPASLRGWLPVEHSRDSGAVERPDDQVVLEVPDLGARVLDRGGARTDEVELAQRAGLDQPDATVAAELAQRRCQ